MSIYEEIAELISEALGVDIKQKTRIRQCVEGRFIYYNIARNFFDGTLEHIGAVVNRNHSTVVHGLEMFDVLISSDKNFKFKYNFITHLLFDAVEFPKKDTTAYYKLTKENEDLKIQIKELTLKAKQFEVNNDEPKRFKSIIERLECQVPHGKELEAEKQLNRFLNGIRF
jgi:hypothetical protein